jgi:uncharacterized Ntn-hydrolase superfamily protein
MFWLETAPTPGSSHGHITLPSLGPQILSALEAGASVEQALKQALAEDRFTDSATRRPCSMN